MSSEHTFQIATETTTDAPALLTDEERTILRHVAEGLTSKEIAAATGRSTHAVEATVRSASRKLGAYTRLQAVATASVSAGSPVGASGLDRNTLDPVQRDLLLMRADGLTVAAAARIVHVSRRTAWRRLADARAALGVSRNAAAVARAVAVGDFDDVDGHLLRLAS